MLSSKMRSMLVWLLPFLVSGGMAFGALIGMSMVSDAATQEGPAGDTAGAAGALLVLICVVVAFVMAMLTVIVTKVLRRGDPNRMARRFGLSVVGGGIIGALGSNTVDVPTAAVWLVLLGLPVLLTWPWHAKAAPEAEKPIE